MRWPSTLLQKRCLDHPTGGPVGVIMHNGVNRSQASSQMWTAPCGLTTASIGWHLSQCALQGRTTARPTSQPGAPAAVGFASRVAVPSRLARYSPPSRPPRAAERLHTPSSIVRANFPVGLAVPHAEHLSPQRDTWSKL